MNTLHHANNLSILQEMPDASVDLIATDPPFNTGRDWGAFNDKWGGLKGYLKFMEQRCVEMHRVLKDTGSFYLHCDPTASHYLKVMLDGVFGIKQFRNEIVWHYPDKFPSKGNNLEKNHDVIFRYSKSDNCTFNKVMVAKKKATKRPLRKYVNGKTIDVRDANGKKIVMTYTEKKADDVWEIPRTIPKANYPTQKPVALYERIIKASSNQGGTVLDPFAGSGTTLDAAQTLGRNWIGIDSGEQAIETIVERMRDRHGLEPDRDYKLNL